MDTDDLPIIPQDPPAAASIRAGVNTRRLIFVLAGVLLGMLLSVLDQTIVGTAMPRVIADLQGLSHYAWVFTAYMLASTVTVPIYGKLSDIHGPRIFYIAGMVIFLIGSALSGTSQNMTQLIIFRAIQGLGAGAMMPIAIAIIEDIFPPAERGKWQGLTASVFGVASIVGPALGGSITDNLSWRWVFYVNMPIGVLAILTAGIALPKMAHQQQRQVDYLGAFLLMAGTIPMLLAFSWAGTSYPWFSIQVIGLLAVSIVVLTIAAIVESQVPEPIISPSLFKNNSFAVSVIATFLASAGLFGAIMYLPRFIEGVGGQSASKSGAILTPLMLGFVGSSIVGGYLISRTGRYRLIVIVSFAVAAVGLYLLSRMNPSTSSMVITGLGIGAKMGLFTIVVQNAFPFSKLGEVTAGLQFFRSVGGTIGLRFSGQS
jgi:EmrB/QacA subfamily drug resistance transporter